MKNTTRITVAFFIVMSSCLSMSMAQYHENDLESNQKKAIELFHQGTEKIEFRDYEDAIQHFTEALVYWPDFKQAYKNRGICYSLMKNSNKAIADYNKALALDPKDPALYNYRGFAKAENGFEQEDHEHFESALEDIDKALELKNDYDEAYLNKGIVLMWLDEHRRAIEMFDKVIELNPNHAKAYFDRGIAYDKLGNIARACMDWSKAKRLGFPHAESMLMEFCE